MSEVKLLRGRISESASAKNHIPVIVKQEILISPSMEKAKRKRAGLLVGIPEDVLCDILQRLPVSSLLRFKAVNRRWCSLISSREFTIQHFKDQANCAGPCPRRYGVIRASDVPQQQMPRLSLFMHRRAEEEYDVDNVVVETAGFDNPLHLLEDYKNTNHVQVFGSCNGLLLIGYGNKPDCFILWNPSTGEEKRLPWNHFCDCPMKFMAGLGYDSSTDSYKVVVAIYDRGTQLTYIAVYNLKTNSWAMVENTEFPYEFSSSQSGITLTNRTPHWVLKRVGGLSNVIIYFDIVEENFRELPLPDRLLDAEKIFLGSCKGFLCAGDFDDYTVWIMKEYGIKECWTTLMDIPLVGSTYSILTFQHLMSLHFTRKSKILMILDQNSVALYKSIGVKYKPISFSGNQEGLIVAAYMESLISPNNYG